MYQTPNVKEHESTLIRRMLLAIICLTLVATTFGVSESAKSNIEWQSSLLFDPSTDPKVAEQARAVTTDGHGNLFAVVESSAAVEEASKTSLYKINLSGSILWVRRATLARGRPFDIAVNQVDGSAFAVVSSIGDEAGVAKAHVIRFSETVASQVSGSRVNEELFYSTPSDVGITKLFGCVVNPSSGDVYVTGGTSMPMFGVSRGKGDIIVIRLARSGEVLSTAQFGSPDEEVGIAIDISSDGLIVALVAKRDLERGGTRSDVYRLHAKNLSIIDGPHVPQNHGATPLFNPMSLALSGPRSSDANAVVAFVTGNALIRPDRLLDMYIHIYATVRGKVFDVLVSFDGAKDAKGIDRCVSIVAGNDGNAYCLGYTDIKGSLSPTLNLVVISPTGELLLRNERNSSDASVLNEVPTACTMVDGEGGPTLAYVGYARIGNTYRATIGFVTLASGTIRAFPGFGDLVQGAGSVLPPRAKKESKEPSTPTVAIIGGALGGFVALMAAVAGLFLLRRHRRKKFFDEKLTPGNEEKISAASQAKEGAPRHQHKEIRQGTLI